MSSSSTTYLNTAAFGLIDPALKAVADNFYTKLAEIGSGVGDEWRLTTEPEIRNGIAGFLNADAKDIAMLPNFSWGMNAVVQSLSGKEKVLLYKDDFPSLLEPFRLNSFNIRRVESPDHFELPLDEIESLIRRKEIDIVALSHVQFSSGYKLPIAELGLLCREHGVCFILDATQSMGAIPIDVSALGVDVLIASNYKWMNAGFGTGVMYIGEDFLTTYPPVVGGFNSFTMLAGAWHHILSARSYEPGHPNMYGLNLLNASITNLQELGVANIEAHNAHLTELLLTNLRELNLPLLGPPHMQHRSSIIVLRDEDGLSDRLRKGGFIVTSRAGRVRISMHRHNSEEEIAALVDYLKK